MSTLWRIVACHTWYGVMTRLYAWHSKMAWHITFNTNKYPKQVSLDNALDHTPGFCRMMSTANIWWRHQMETFSALLAICAGNSPVTGAFPAQRPVTRSFDAFFDLRLNIRLSKQSWGWWFETLSCPLCRHCNETMWYPVALAKR